MALPEFSMRQLLEAGVHYGHQTARWNPKMGQYIYGDRNGIHIIDLTQTVPMLEQALKVVRDTVAKNGRILFVGTKRQAQKPIAEAETKTPGRRLRVIPVIASTRSLVRSTRLSRMRRLRSLVQRAEIGSPARWMRASRSPRSTAPASASDRISSAPATCFEGFREKATTVQPRRLPSAMMAEPRKPLAPVMPTFMAEP